MADEKTYNMLNVNDTSTWRDRRVARDGGDGVYTMNISEGLNELDTELSSILKKGLTFRNAVFTTHGNKGCIFFGDDPIHSKQLYELFYRKGHERLFPFPNAHILFNGCNVAESDVGWKFLEAAARCFLSAAGGTAFGWTSVGFGTFWGGSHVKHLWGDTRAVAVFAGGAVLRYYSNWDLIQEGGAPVKPY